MKPRFSNQRNHALTLIEVLMVVVILVLLAALLLPMLAAARRKSSRIGCVNNLKEIGLAGRVWEGDNGDKYPMEIPVTNGGSMELVATGNVLVTFLVMSNELSTPRILHCPEDMEHIETSSFATLTSFNISYFIGADVTNETAPQAILSGDDNLEVGGMPVKSGLLELPKNTPVAWTAARHKFVGNIALADGSVQQFTARQLQNTLNQSTLATNRFAIP
jgi:prepilin-type N-terminal cleavage/methylation domain-containing protein/prepilin-type processing-associated H-X9-DG protein